MSLTFSKVSKFFKKIIVLDNLSLSIASGETLVLFGPSGSGKTVFLRLIAGVIKPDCGTIYINGKNMHEVMPEKRGIGMAFQNFALFPHMDAHQNIASPLYAQRQSRSTINAKVQNLARILKIDHVLNHKPKELSNGQKQRTALARALIGQPKILLLDDPLRNVDAKLRFEMRLQFPRLLKNHNTTVIYVTQDYKEAMAIGDQIAIINNNKIQQLAPPQDIYLRPSTIETARLFGDPMINLLDVIPTAQKDVITINISNQQIIIGHGYKHYLNKECILGIRPEALYFVDINRTKIINAFPITVEAETPLNEKTVNLMVTKQGRELMLSRPAGSIGACGKRGYVTFNMENALLFDKSNGKRIIPLNRSQVGLPV